MARRRGLRWGACALTLSTLLFPHAYAESADSESGKVTSVRYWTLSDVTRIAIEVDADFKFKSEHLIDPERLFFDIRGVKPSVVAKGMRAIPVGDGVVKQIRVAETQPGVTRVVLDLEQKTEFTASQLAHPARLMIELKRKEEAPAAPPVKATPVSLPRLEVVELASTASLHVKRREPRKFNPPPIDPKDLVYVPKQIRQDIRTVMPPLALSTLGKRGKMPAPNSAATVAMRLPLPPAVEQAALLPPMPSNTYVASSGISALAKPEPKAITITGKVPLPAKKNSNGDQSLTRVLGLKLGRVVLDAGHGGHDAGTRGPSGLAEKDLVLDVALRLGAMLEERLGSEVVYTRKDDTFIPLEERTRIANEHRADLFLSIHANSSPVRSVSGVETYYLSFTTSKTALDLASRENASGERSIFDLKDLLGKIALKDKVDESREFAFRLQNSLYSISAKSNKATRDRGIKKAPFVVLIGADMPSVLAEIGFLTNSADEALLRKEEHRDKIAEALFKGISSYADSLSRTVVAQSK